MKKLRKMTAEIKELKQMLLMRSKQPITNKEANEKVVYAIKKTIKLGTGDPLPVAVFQNCDTKSITKLFWSENNPVLAIEINFEYANINWSAGIGWPEYNVPAPNGLSPAGAGFYKPSLGKHAIICEFGGQDFQTPVLAGEGRGQYLSPVSVFVNDDKYDDNNGTFDFHIISYKEA